MEFCLGLGISGVSYNGEYQLIICENLAKRGYYLVIPCAVYDRDGEMIYRFNVQAH